MQGFVVLALLASVCLACSGSVDDAKAPTAGPPIPPSGAESAEEQPATRSDDPPSGAESAEEQPATRSDDPPSGAESAEEQPATRSDDPPSGAESAEEQPATRSDDPPSGAPDPGVVPPPPQPVIVPIVRASDAPVVSIAGPLLVFSSDRAVESPLDWPEIQQRRVSLYDVATAQYWDAFEYFRPRGRGYHAAARTDVQIANEKLIVWSREYIARVSLTGQRETWLLRHAEIRAMQVSPDGQHVAVLVGSPGTLLILDTTTGVVQRRYEEEPEGTSGSLPDRWRTGEWQLGDWNPDGTVISLTTDGLIVLVGLDGTTDALPPDWGPLAPDHQHVVRLGAVLGSSKSTGWQWSHWDILDTTTGQVRWTISSPDGLYEPSWIPTLIPRAPAWEGTAQTLAFQMPYAGDQILDLATGAIRPLAYHSRDILDAGDCHQTAAVDWTTFPHPCDLWQTYHGMIEPDDRFGLRPQLLRALAPTLAPPVPPSRATLSGTLLLYEVDGPYVAILDAVGSPRHVPSRRIHAYDVRTGKDWLIASYPAHALTGQPGQVKIAQDGLVVPTAEGLRYLSFDGQTTILLHDDSGPAWAQLFWPHSVQVSPDGQKVAAKLPHGDLVVSALPSGDVILRRTDAALITAWEQQAPPRVPRYGPCPKGLPSWRLLLGHTCFSALLGRWAADSTTLWMHIGVCCHDGGEAGGATVQLDGTIGLLDLDQYQTVEPEPPTDLVARSRIDCRETLRRLCHIRLNDQSVGQGRWPIIIGSLTLD